MVNEGSEDQIDKNESQQEVYQDLNRRRSQKSKEAIMVQEYLQKSSQRYS